MNRPTIACLIILALLMLDAFPAQAPLTNGDCRAAWEYHHHAAMAYSHAGMQVYHHGAAFSASELGNANVSCKDWDRDLPPVYDAASGEYKTVVVAE